MSSCPTEPPISLTTPGPMRVSISTLDRGGTGDTIEISYMQERGKVRICISSHLWHAPHYLSTSQARDLASALLAMVAREGTAL